MTNTHQQRSSSAAAAGPARSSPSTWPIAGRQARTASRHGSDLFFDWDDPATYAAALEGVDRVYLVTPVMRVRYADQVAVFLDQAEAAGVRHVTLLSTYNGDQAPREVDVAAVEADLAGREAIHALDPAPRAG